MSESIPSNTNPNHNHTESGTGRDSSNNFISSLSSSSPLPSISPSPSPSSSPNIYIPTDKELTDGLSKLRERVNNSALLSKANLSDQFLIRTLYAKHNDIDASEKMLNRYTEWHVKYLNGPANRLSISHVHSFLLLNILQILPESIRDSDGLRIVYMRPNIYFPGNVHYKYVINALTFLLEELTSDHHAAKYGFTFICDMNGWGWNNFGTSYASNFFSTISGTFPVRIRKFVLVNAPSMFPAVWAIIKRMMSKELASKFTFVNSSEINTITKVDLKLIPREIGGCSEADPSLNAEAFIRACYEKEGLTYSPIDLAKVDWKVGKLDLK